MKPEDDGLLGGLPRSRPGTRSSRRAPGSGARAGDTPDRETPGRDREARAGARAGETPDRETTRGREREPRAGDPVGDAVRTATRTAEVGLRVAQQVTREVIRRLPRV